MRGLSFRAAAAAVAALLAPAVIAAGCDSPDPIEPYLGLWSQTQTVTSICDDGSGGVDSTSGDVSVTRGTVSDLIRTSLSDTACALPLDILVGSPKRAELHADTQCPTAAWIIEIATWSLTLDNPFVATESGSGRIYLDTGNCAVQITTQLQR